MTAPRRAYESAETKNQTNQQFTGTAADRPDKLFKALKPAEPDFTEALNAWLAFFWEFLQVKSELINH